MQREFHVPLNKMSEVATNRLLWKRNFGIAVTLQPLVTLEAGATKARVTVRGNSTEIAAFKDHLVCEGLVEDHGCNFLSRGGLLPALGTVDNADFRGDTNSGHIREVCVGRE